MSTELILILIIVIASLAMSAWSVYISGKKVTVANVVEASKETFSNIDDIIKVAREGVQAAEQLWATGQVPETETGDKHPKFYYVADLVRTQFPDISDDAVEAAVESAVFWLQRILPAVLNVAPVAQPEFSVTTDSGVMITLPATELPKM